MLDKLTKYQLAFVINGQRVLRYGSEAGKGDHRYIGEREHEKGAQRLAEALA